MPLPSNPDMPWPPKVLAPVYEKFAEWGAWYSGDTSRLSKFYGRERPNLSGVLDTRSTYRFWGEATPKGETRAKLHIPLAADIAQTSARLLFSEPPTLTATDAKTQERLDELVDDGTHATFLGGAELSSAKGTSYLRIVWDQSLRPRPWIARVDASSVVPEWRWGVLVALTVWRELENNGSRIVRYLERHEPGTIWHGVFEGTRDRLGDLRDVGGWPDTSWLKTLDGVQWRGLAAAVPTVEGRLTAVFVPNVTPNRIWSDLPVAADFGRSDFESVEGLFDALDEAWSSLMRELRLAVARLYVPATYLQSLGPGKGAMFDVSQEIFVGLQTMGDDEKGLNVQMVQPDIRVEQHLRIAEAITRNIVETAGYSAQSFGMADGVAATATEVVARERESFIGRDGKIMYWRPALKEILETLLMVDAKVFNSPVIPQMPEINFGDSVSEDPEKVARTLQLLDAADAISTYLKVKTRNPDWDDTAIGLEVDRILKETGKSVQDPGTFTGGPPQELPGQITEPNPPA